MKKLKSVKIKIEDLTEGNLVTGKIFYRIEGGYAIDLGGLLGFLPITQISIRKPNDEQMSQLMFSEQSFKILRLDKTKKIKYYGIKSNFFKIAISDRFNRKINRKGIYCFCSYAI